MPASTDAQRAPAVPLSADRGLWANVVTNLLAFVPALLFDWRLGEVLWIYWGQSIVIGFASIARMLKLKQFSTEGFTSNDEPVPETPKGKRDTALFFFVHYGGFHLGYLAFVANETPVSEMTRHTFLSIFACIVTFAVSHGYSFVSSHEEDFKDRKPNLGTLMFYPYLRIIPMHLTIIFGTMLGVESWALVLFMLLKTAADAGMHRIEHHLFRKLGTE